MRKNVLLLLLLFIGVGSSQDAIKLGGLQDLQNKVSKKSAQLQVPESPELDGALDEKSYRVGPGDVVSVIVGEDFASEQQVMVSPEGLLVLPVGGSIDVNGLTLAEMKDQVRRVLAGKYFSQDIYISLVRLRIFRVTVNGAVYYPGFVSVNAMNRVSDALVLAGGVILPASLPQEEDPREKLPGTRKPQPEETLTAEELEELGRQVGSKRNVIIKRKNGEPLRADILKYEVSGDLDSNPYLLDGDVIIVESVQEDMAQVSIYGSVRSPGDFEFVSGDCIHDLLVLSQGFRLDADSSRMELVRFQSDGRQVEVIEISIDWNDESSVKAAMSTKLRADDRLFVRPISNFHQKRTVEVKGEVRYPGKYALSKNATKLSDIIQAAGGFTHEAMLNGAYIVRNGPEKEDREFDRLDLMLVNEMDDQEKAYYRARAREIKGLISVNFTALFSEGKTEHDISLIDQDEIIIPAKEYTVNVIGQVKNPGIVTYESDRKFDYYLGKAGGFSTDAWRKKVRIVKAGGGEILATSETTVEMGDTIVVPQKVEKDFWEAFRDYAYITTQIGTIIMVIAQINYWSSLQKR
ncbi:MAG: hypothetical protein EHM72_00190 [Calditrichaeota bacterium]|nr:MAG: hypothetical protein EHM72_00190 [Calditrichota bacterium]